MSITPVKRTRAYEEIVRQLADMIRRGELKPGDRLPSERDLATAFGVGRPTLRQALTVLTEAGVLEAHPGSGVYLRKAATQAAGAPGNAMSMVLMTEKMDLVHILELRIGIEGEAAYLAALRRTPEQLEKLQAAYEAHAHALETRGLAMTEDYRFHAAVGEATGNPVFVKVMLSLADLFAQQLQQTTLSLFHEPDRIEAVRREHEEILAAVAEQRADDARALAVGHLRRVLERLKRAEESHA